MKFRHIALALTLITLPLAAQPTATTTLRPVGPWVINDLPNGCIIARQFGEVAQPVTLSFARFLTPLDVIAGIDGAYSDEAFRADRFRLEHAGDVARSAIVWAARRPGPNEPDIRGRFDALRVAEARQSRAILHVSRGSRAMLAFDFDGLAAALTALRSCQDRLYQGLNVDVDEIRRVAVDVEPLANGNWVTSSDLPRQFNNMTTSLTTGVLAYVNANGTVDRCTITQSSGEPLLDLQSCRVVVARGRFRPARDGEGRNVPSLYTRNIRWNAPGY